MVDRWSGGGQRWYEVAERQYE
ncbi:hypothetical protein Tco_0387844, partial [Tanacetum coccineum]